MKIAVNTRLLVSKKMDGIGRFTYETLKQITKDHPEVEFTFIFDRKVDPYFVFAENVKKVVLAPQARHPILWYLWFEIQLKKYINKNDFALFLSPEGWVPPKLNCKSLAVMHDLNFEHFPENIAFSHRAYLKHYFPKFAERSHRIATVSEFSKQDIVNCYGFPAEEIDVVYNGANKIFRKISEKQQEAFKSSYSFTKDFFIFIGTLHPRKNLEHLFKGFEIFKKESGSEMKLLVVGNRKWWPNQLEVIYQSMSSKQDVIFLGRLDDEELSVALGSATALTYLPYFEGFGIPILEAFQAEVPVITSSVSSMPEVAAGGALLCDPKNEKEIAAAMREVTQNKEIREKLISRGKERARDFSWERTSTLLWESIRKTMN